MNRTIHLALHALLVSAVTAFVRPSFAMGGLPDIVFYGRVLDQYVQPVEGASVWFSGEHAYLLSGGGNGFAHTDQEGYFTINTTGAALVLGSVRHSEIDKVVYYTVPDRYNPSTLTYKNTVRMLSNGNKHVTLNYNDYRRKDNAYEIRVWRMGQYAGALRGFAAFNIPSDGTKSSFTFDVARKSISLVSDRSKAHFHMSCNRSAMEHYQDFSDWNLNIDVADGGIIETDDLYLNLAPATSYGESWTVDMREGTSSFRRRLFKRFYFVTASGKQYGGLKAKFEPFLGPSEQSCRVYLDYKINPTGSRNLELRL